jgi:hypothetical protein
MKRKLTPTEKAEKQRRKALFTTVFMSGKMKRVRRASPLVDGIPADQFLVQNGNAADLTEHEMWEHLSKVELDC